MADFEHIRSVKRAAQSVLLGRPGVHAVGIGAKTVGGKRTAEPAILVFVVRKKPLSELRPAEVIPPEINGVKTDVIERAMPTLAFGDNPDPSPYSTLLGGIMIKPGGDLRGTGTLGCIAQTNETTPRIVALTCHHVVGTIVLRPTSLIINVSPSQRQITVLNANLPGSIVVTTLLINRANGDLAAFELYVRTGTMTLPDVAAAVRDRINGLADQDFNATSASNVVTINPLNGAVVLTTCTPYGRVESDKSADLHVTVAGNVAAFSGQTSGEFYIVYATLYIGGVMTITRGVGVLLSKGQALADVASALATRINGLNVAGLSATSAGAQVTVTGVQAMEWFISSDGRVGQPDNDFACSCCQCCNSRIGRVVDAQLEIDAAMVQLDPKHKYKAEEQDLGIVTGTHNVTEAEALAGYPVKKRGARTRETHGLVTSSDTSGFISAATGTPPQPVAYRRYDNVLQVDASPSPDPSNGTFGLPGDSGSAVVNAAGEVVGILFGVVITGTPPNEVGTPAFVTPIQQVLDRFHVGMSTATAPGQVKVVPDVAGAQAALESGPPAGPTWERIQHVEREIGATPEGKSYVDMVRRNALEMQMLVNRKRSVVVAWQRNGGPVLVRALIDSLDAPSRPFPSMLGEKPLEACVAEIAEAVRPHASDGLASDLELVLPVLTGLGGKTYSDLLQQLQAHREDPASPRRSD